MATKQTLTGLIRSRMGTYIERQRAGESQKTFAEELCEEGRPISYSNFRTLFSRARKQLGSNNTKTIEKQSTIENKDSSSNSGFVYQGTETYNENDLF